MTESLSGGRLGFSELLEDELALPGVRRVSAEQATVVDIGRERVRNLNGRSDPASRSAVPESIDWMTRVREGDSQAFEKIVGQLWQGTLLYALSLAGEGDTAEDLAQQAFAGLWQNRASYRGGPVRVWLLRSVRHLFISRQRRARIHARWAVGAQSQPPSGPRTPLQEVEEKELRMAIRGALESLSPRRREAFTLVHLQGLSYKEVGEIMEVRPQTVANYLQAALTDLRVLLQPYFPSFRAIRLQIEE